MQADETPDDSQRTEPVTQAAHSANDERASLIAEATRLLGGGLPLTPEELAEDPYINYRS